MFVPSQTSFHATIWSLLEFEADKFTAETSLRSENWSKYGCSRVGTKRFSAKSGSRKNIFLALLAFSGLYMQRKVRFISCSIEMHNYRCRLMPTCARRPFVENWSENPPLLLTKSL